MAKEDIPKKHYSEPLPADPKVITEEDSSSNQYYTPAISSSGSWYTEERKERIKKLSEKTKRDRVFRVRTNRKNVRLLLTDTGEKKKPKNSAIKKNPENIIESPQGDVTVKKPSDRDAFTPQTAFP